MSWRLALTNPTMPGPTATAGSRWRRLPPECWLRRGNVKSTNTCVTPRLQSVIAIATVVWVLAIAAGCGLLRFESPGSDQARAFLTSLDSEFAVNADQARLDECSSFAYPTAFAATVPPRSATTLVALGAIVAVAAIVGSLNHLLVPARRGPPRALTTVFTSQDLLTRFCIARR